VRHRVSLTSWPSNSLCIQVLFAESGRDASSLAPAARESSCDGLPFKVDVSAEARQHG
jgi:hypothetical protein